MGAGNCCFAKPPMRDRDGLSIARLPTNSGRCLIARIRSRIAKSEPISTRSTARRRYCISPTFKPPSTAVPRRVSFFFPESVCLEASVSLRQQSLFVGSFLLICGLAVAQDQDYSKVQMKVTKVAGTVYMLEGADAGNIGASVGDDGIVIVDDQYAPLADKIQAALKGITDKPIRFVINTHYHGDHTGGNAYFQKQ